MSPTSSSPEAHRDEFLRWQCAIRQLVARRDHGRPGPGMMLRGRLPSGHEIPALITILNRRPEHDMVRTWRFLVQRTEDPRTRREAAVQLLASTYFQHPERFSDRLTTIVDRRSRLAGGLGDGLATEVRFEQFGTAHEFEARLAPLAPGHPLHAATDWFARAFNPHLPPGCLVVGIEPRWARARETLSGRPRQGTGAGGPPRPAMPVRKFGSNSHRAESGIDHSTLVQSKMTSADLATR